VAAAVLSGNRNFEGRIHQRIRGNFLASPPLVVAYALAGTVDIDLSNDPIGTGTDGKEIRLADIWPTEEEIAALIPVAADPEKFQTVYQSLLTDNETWNQIPSTGETMYAWDRDSTYIQEPPFFVDMTAGIPPAEPIRKARVLLLLGDSVTTDHISPAGAFPPDSPAGRYLVEAGVDPKDFNSYGSRRGNDRVMTRGTFANIRIRNKLGQGREGGWTTHLPSGELTTVYEASLRYRDQGVPTVVLAGIDYGMGSSRDWAAKGTYLLGVRAVIARSFERIHRSNLIGMGVLPLQFAEGDSADGLGLTGRETFTIPLGDDLKPGQEVIVEVQKDDGASRSFPVICRIDTPVEMTYYRNGGILHTVLRNMLD
jgi:aconitate hydratase